VAAALRAGKAVSEEEAAQLRSWLDSSLKDPCVCIDDVIHVVGYVLSFAFIGQGEIAAEYVEVYEVVNHRLFETLDQLTFQSLQGLLGRASTIMAGFHELECGELEEAVVKSLLLLGQAAVSYRILQYVQDVRKADPAHSAFVEAWLTWVAAARALFLATYSVDFDDEVEFLIMCCKDDMPLLNLLMHEVAVDAEEQYSPETRACAYNMLHAANVRNPDVWPVLEIFSFNVLDTVLQSGKHHCLVQEAFKYLVVYAREMSRKRLAFDVHLEKAHTAALRKLEGETDHPVIVFEVAQAFQSAVCVRVVSCRKHDIWPWYDKTRAMMKTCTSGAQQCTGLVLASAKTLRRCVFRLGKTARGALGPLDGDLEQIMGIMVRVVGGDDRAVAKVIVQYLNADGANFPGESLDVWLARLFDIVRKGGARNNVLKKLTSGPWYSAHQMEQILEYTRM
jgi:hypothetical protein